MMYICMYLCTCICICIYVLHVCASLHVMVVVESSHDCFSNVYIYTCTCRSVDDDYDEYGRSLEDDEPLSPSTAGNDMYT